MKAEGEIEEELRIKDSGFKMISLFAFVSLVVEVGN
jgi:hypothetical protein